MRHKLFLLILKLGKSILSMGLIILFFYYGQGVPFEKQFPLYDGLRNTSAIIFGVMGAWVALIYPEALSAVLNSKEGGIEKSRLQAAYKILSALVISSIILTVVLLVSIFAPILRQIPWFTSNFKLLRGFSYSVIGIMTVGQLWSVLLTLLPADVIKQSLDAASARKRNNKLLTSQTRRVTKESPQKDEDIKS